MRIGDSLPAVALAPDAEERRARDDVRFRRPRAAGRVVHRGDRRGAHPARASDERREIVVDDQRLSMVARMTATG
jgi:hypothetical protein